MSKVMTRLAGGVSARGRIRGGSVIGGGETRYYDFTTMTSEQLLSPHSGWSISRDNAIYVPDSAGDYAEIAAGVMAKSDLGVMCFGGFTNVCPNGLLAGAVAGSPGTKPTGWDSLGTYQATLALPGTMRGLPAIELVNSGAGIDTPTIKAGITSALGDKFSFSAIGLATLDYTYLRIAYTANQSQTLFSTTEQLVKVEDDSAPAAGPAALLIRRSSGSRVTFAGPQGVYGLSICPNVLALSSAASTVTASQIPVLSRVTPGECSFVLPVVTSPGRKGTDDVIASASLDANNQLLVVHEEADNNILLRLVTSGSTVGERDLGVVGDNVYTVVRGSVSTGRLAGALEGMEEMLEITGSGIIPPPYFERWTLGNDHAQAAGTQFWGSVLGLRIN